MTTTIESIKIKEIIEIICSYLNVEDCLAFYNFLQMPISNNVYNKFKKQNTKFKNMINSFDNRVAVHIGTPKYCNKCYKFTQKIKVCCVMDCPKLFCFSCATIQLTERDIYGSCYCKSCIKKY